MKSRLNKKSLTTLIIVGLLVILIASIGIFAITGGEKVSKELSVGECQKIIDDSLFTLAKPTALGAKKIFSNSAVTVKSVKAGNQKNLILDCEYKTIDALSAVSSHKDELMSAVYEKYLDNETKGISTNATRVSIDIGSHLSIYLEEAKPLVGRVTFQVFEQDNGKFILYFDDAAIDKCFGGLISLSKEIGSITSVNLNGKKIDISKKNTLRTGINQCLALKNYDNKIPNVGSPIVKWWNDFTDEFSRNFIAKSQWKYLTDGLLITLSITGLSAMIGVIIGFVVAIIRCTYQTTGKLKILDSIFSVYLTIMRGTPVMVQLLIIYFVFLLPAGVDKFPAAVLCFGLNSGAYVAEIVRGGIMSIDKGQIEAGRSLGFNYPATMYHIVIPQAFKAVLPALANEFITLLKESSVAFYIGVADLTQGGLKIRSITYSNFMPLIAVAIIYLIIVMILTKLVGILERRLRKSDH